MHAFGNNLNLKPPVARKLAVGHTSVCCVISKLPWFFHDYSGFFKFHDFSMHGTFLVIFQVFHDFQSLWEPFIYEPVYERTNNLTGYESEQPGHLPDLNECSMGSGPMKKATKLNTQHILWSDLGMSRLIPILLREQSWIVGKAHIQKSN